LKTLLNNIILMYAIVDIAGQQFKVEKDQKIFVHRLEGKEGSKVDFDKVLLVDNDGKVTVGEPVIKNMIVSASIVSHLKGDKVKVFKKKRRKGYRVLNGHRQYLTEIHIDGIGEGKTKAKAEPKKEAEKKPDPKKEVKTEAKAAPNAGAKETAKKTTIAKPKAAPKATTETKETAKAKPAAKKTSTSKPKATAKTEKKAATKKAPAKKPATKATSKAKKADDK
jgi:large subunit ribosomal protein L21